MVVVGAALTVPAAVFISVVTAIEWLRTGKVDQTDISGHFTIVVMGVVFGLLFLLLWAFGAGLDILIYGGASWLCFCCHELDRKWRVPKAMINCSELKFGWGSNSSLFLLKGFVILGQKLLVTIHEAPASNRYTLSFNIRRIDRVLKD